MNKPLLKEFIRRILKEGMKTVSDAKADGLALVIIGHGDYSQIVLYKPEVYLSRLTEVLNEIKKEEGSAIQIDEAEFIEEISGIIGQLEFGRDPDPDSGPCLDANVVRTVGADNGYGPLLYEIAMSLSPALTSDRTSVKPAAEKVWDKFQNSRGDVSKEPFDDIKNPKTPPPEDDCKIQRGRNSLNYAYKLENSPNVESLNAAHEDFLREIKRLCLRVRIKPPASMSIEHRIGELGEEFFEQKYFEY